MRTTGEGDEILSIRRLHISHDTPCLPLFLNSPEQTTGIMGGVQMPNTK